MTASSSQEIFLHMIVARISYFLTVEDILELLEKYYEQISKENCIGDSIDREIVNMLENMIVYKRSAAREES